ncbi:iron uptake transporter permease EfeU [Tsukamurella soli]|uniref:High-affinity iron transporter n=1 Tax=Tsukamurella soli TaxID=644556 RepID=A0ABP8JUU1_9ACTN
MFATLVIGLREGLEAALIVGIIAAFLRKQGQTRVLVWMWLGVAAAAALCVAVAIGLEVLAGDLPQRQQEMLETVIGVVAIGMVTYMIVWMRGHARDLKGEIESAASGAVANGSAIALAVMAGLAVLREGLETSVFLVAAFNAGGNAGAAGFGAVLGIAIAGALGYGIYRGGVRIDLAKFFKATGLMLVLVAAGLVMTAFHTAHEAGWIDFGQRQVANLTWLVRPGSLQESLLTGVLGLQQRPVVIEVGGWLVYLVVVGATVLWPAGRPAPLRSLAAAFGTAGLALVVSAVVVVAGAPAAPALPPATLALGDVSAASTAGILAGRAVTPPSGVTVTVAHADSAQATGTLHTGPLATALPRLTATGGETPGGAGYTQVASPDVDIAALVPGAPTTVSLPQIIAANGGRIPVGLNITTFGGAAKVVYTAVANVSVTVDPATGRPGAGHVVYAVTATAVPTRGAATVLGKVATVTVAHRQTAAESAAVSAAAAQRDSRASRTGGLPIGLAVAGALAGVAAALSLRGVQRRSRRGALQPKETFQGDRQQAVSVGAAEKKADAKAENTADYTKERLP